MNPQKQEYTGELKPESCADVNAVAATVFFFCFTIALAVVFYCTMLHHFLDCSPVN